ncbi:hypothetical protein HGRIS_004888 [Hohenbuehelia grisea]|uniref:Ubiquinone biosynthesis monooxygenase COQ6, mitochondrial n=1 Tax=Hohenbuehelia grisea TaxID=104357 RepID=A0ABR3JDI3_9AGAR
MTFTTATRSLRSSAQRLRKCSVNRHMRRGYAEAVASAQNHEECDIVIVGGGPVGLGFASALASNAAVRDTLRVVLVEAGDLSKVHDWQIAPEHYSNRVSSLTNASQSFLQGTGAWEYVEQGRTNPVEDMQVWDGVSDARIAFHASDMFPGSSSELPQMARLTENLNLQRGLLRHLRTTPQIQLMDKTKVKNIIRDESSGNWPIVQLNNNRSLRARLLVGADGFNSPVRSYAKIPAFGWSYNTQAIVATMNHPPPSPYLRPDGFNTTAYQRFLPTGPIAFLPLSPTVSSLVWSINPPELSKVLSANPAILKIMINAAFRLPEQSMRYLYDFVSGSVDRAESLSEELVRKEVQWREQAHGIAATSAYASSLVGANEVGIPPADADMVPPLVTSIQPGTVASFPLKFNHAEGYIGEGHAARTVLVGDAAHSVHPLAGQGLNLGLADVECLSRCVANAVNQGGDVGSYTALLPYTQERYPANHTLMSAVDKLHKLYSTTAAPVVWARGVGLEVLNELDSIKAAFMMAAGAQVRNPPSEPGSAQTREHANAWATAAASVEGAMNGIGIAKAVGGGLAGVLGDRLQDLGRSLGRGGTRPKN